MIPLRKIDLSKSVMVAAHRGSSGTAPENTLAAYRQAVEAGADFVEADVQMTLDGYAVAFHDKNLSRTTDFRGKVSDVKYEQFSNADAGSWFDEKYKHEHVPLISEVIRTIKNHCYLNIELKNIEGNELGDNIEKIIEIVRDEEYEEFTVFSSFYYNTLFRLKQKYPSFPTAAIMIPKDKRLPSQILAETGAEAFIAEKTEFTDEIIDDIMKHNIIAAIYTVNSREDFEYAMSLPVKVLVTNFPAKIREYLHEYKG